MSATVSVVIPTYNRAALVTEAIESALSQSHPIHEIIVVDDGSTDSTPQALSRFGDRILVVRQENRGVNDARNRALQIATGTYIALLDNDDVWLPFKTELLLAALERYPGCGFAFSDFFIWKPGVCQQPRGLRTWHRSRHVWEELFSEQASSATLNFRPPTTSMDDFDVFSGDIYAASLAEPFVLPSTAVIRRECVGDLLFDSMDSTCGDWSFFARLSRSSGAVFVDKETVLNRSHEDSVRLTRLDHRTQVQRRLTMTRDVWGSDAHFMDSNPGQIERIIAMLLHKLAKLELREGKRERAFEYLEDARKLPEGARSLENLLLRLLGRHPLALELARRSKRLADHLRR